MSCRILTLPLVAVSVAFQLSFGSAGADEPTKAATTVTAAVKPDWRPLVDSWEVIRFGGEGNVDIEKNLIAFSSGDPLTGVRWKGDVPTENYEVELEARRTDGFDFFCGLTFPIGKGHASLILGGWGGGVVGLSSINDQDASANETTQFKPFENNQWYKVRVRVTPAKIECFIDGQSMVDVQREDKLFSTRFEMDSSIPLGIAAYQCTAEFRNLRIRKLDAPKSAGKKEPSSSTTPETAEANAEPSK